MIIAPMTDVERARMEHAGASVAYNNMVIQSGR
jgi:hypothetical protein